MEKKYNCVCCDYSTNTKGHYTKHLTTKKHQVNDNKKTKKVDEIVEIVEIEEIEEIEIDVEDLNCPKDSNTSNNSSNVSNKPEQEEEPTLLNILNKLSVLKRLKELEELKKSNELNGIKEEECEIIILDATSTDIGYLQKNLKLLVIENTELQEIVEKISDSRQQYYMLTIEYLAIVQQLKNEKRQLLKEIENIKKSKVIKEVITNKKYIVNNYGPPIEQNDLPLLTVKIEEMEESEFNELDGFKQDGFVDYSSCNFSNN
jgi:hypothetical protein